MEQEYKYMVCTKCFTYNQESYIEETLYGFVMQETSFPTVTIVVDDASTDNTANVIRTFVESCFDLKDTSIAYEKETDYAHITFARHRTNKNCYFVVIYLKENHHKQRKPKHPYFKEWSDNAKYTAVCEGDDYWVYPKKLEMQVEFMEAHPEYIMCHTDFDLTNGEVRNHKVFIDPDDNYFPHSVLYGMRVGTLTMLYRNSEFQKLPHLNIGKGWQMGDLPLIIEMSHEGKIKYFPIVTAKYRILNHSASHGSLDKEIAFTNSALSIRQFYANYYGIELPNNGYTKGYFITMEKYAFKHKNREIAKEYYILAKQYNMVSKKLLLFYYATNNQWFGKLVSRVYKSK